ncbi:MAG: pectic acid lyase, partial [Planctomycetaceae bacterium]|nr:pectic acid lyase [Planctomycetaceae bacterium]
PRALAYYKKRLLPDDQVARYYEFKTNKPLYMDGKYQLTYDDSAAPSHYGWKQSARFDEIDKAHQDAKNGLAPPLPRTTKDLEENVRRIIRELDDDGRWITTYAGERLVGQPKFSPSFRYISSDVFSRNVETLSEYVASSRE